MARQSDLFGARVSTPRGWTELDKVRARIQRLEKKADQGDFTAEDLEDLRDLRQTLSARELEASEKWKRSCGR